MIDPILINLQEAKKLLSLTENNIRWLIRTRRIPFVRVGERRIFFDPDELREWRDKNRVPTIRK